MLKKANRLKSRRDFKQTLSGRRLCINDCFVLYGLPVRNKPFPNPTAQPPLGYANQEVTLPLQTKIGFVVSKKVHKSSVFRNRVKRQLRELIRLQLMFERQNSQPEMLARYRTLIFILRAGSLNINFQMMGERLKRCLQNI